MTVKVASVETSGALAMSTLVSQRFEEALNASQRTPRGRGALGASGGGGRVRRSSGAPAARLLSRAHHVGRAQPTLAVLSHRAARFAARLLRRERAGDDRRAARRAAGGAGRRLGVPAARRRADDGRALARGARRLRRAPRGARAASIAGPTSSRRRRGSRRTSSAITRARSATSTSCSGFAPRDGQVASSLERLLERHERWAELVAVAAVPARDARRRRGPRAAPAHRRARCTTSSASPTRRSRRCASLLPDLHEDAPLARLLERLLADERATPETRLEALDALRIALRGDRRRRARPGAAARRRSASRPATALRELRRECGDRLHALGDVSGALDQYVALDRARARGPRGRGRPAPARRGGARDPARLAAGAGGRGGAPARRTRTPRRAAGARGARRGSAARTHPNAASALFEDALAGEAGAPRAARSRAFAGWRRSTTRSATRRSGSTRSSGSRPSSRSRAPSASPGRSPPSWRWSSATSTGRSAPGRRGSRWTRPTPRRWRRARAAGRGSNAGRRSSTCCAGASRARPPAHQIRADLIEMATLARDRLRRHRPRDRRSGARWSTRFGDDDESVGALADLYTESGAFAELARAAVAQRATSIAGGTPIGSRAWPTRIACGSATRAAAIEWYGRALDVDPAHEGARAGLQALLAEPSVAPAAARRLARPPPRRPTRWQLLLDLVPLRLAARPTPGERARILEDAAACAEARAGDQTRALAWLCAGAAARGRERARSNARCCASPRRPATSRARRARSARPSPPAARRR